MGRRRTAFANQKRTTWSVSFEIDDIMRTNKGRRESIEEFLDRIFTEWKGSKESVSFYEEAYQKQSLVIERLAQEISLLKQPLLSN